MEELLRSMSESTRWVITVYRASMMVHRLGNDDCVTPVCKRKKAGDKQAVRRYVATGKGSGELARTVDSATNVCDSCFC